MGVHAMAWNVQLANYLSSGGPERFPLFVIALMVAFAALMLGFGWVLDLADRQRIRKR
jgi:hypothetical protein